MKKRFSRSRADLLHGPVSSAILSFAIPLFFGQLLQQTYNLVDAWVIGNFADTNAFAAVSSNGTIVFLIISLFSGVAMGGSVIISRYYGSGDEENVSRAIHSNFLLGLLASLLSTVVGLLMAPQILRWMNTPAEVMVHSLSYLRIYFAGVTTVILYNVCMSVMRALGDSTRPLLYLLLSTVVNIVLDLLLVAKLQMGVAGAALATVFSQGISLALCLFRLFSRRDYTGLSLKKLRFHPFLLRQVVEQGLPAGLQSAVITIGNLAVQTAINGFGSCAMSGYGAYAKIESLIFLPVNCMSLALPTFISQNLGARQYDRARQGAAFGIICSFVLAELTGVLIRLWAAPALSIFISDPEAISFGITHLNITSLFFGLVAFSHGTGGVLRGSGRATVPMVSMLVLWCGVRLVYVNTVLPHFYSYATIAWVYPLTWLLSTIFLAVFLFHSDWAHYYENRLAAQAVRAKEEIL